jgi:hypothetical protein
MWSGGEAPLMLTSILNGTVSITSPSLYFRRNISRHGMTNRMCEHQSLSGHGCEKMKFLFWRRIELWSSNLKSGRYAVIVSPVHKLKWELINGVTAQAVTVLTWIGRRLFRTAAGALIIPSFCLLLVYTVLPNFRPLSGEEGLEHWTLDRDA